MKYDLSIIVPIYNIEDYLEKAIDSLIFQSEYNYEIILVNDGSTDSCSDICKKYQGNSKIKIVEKENGGLVSARKAGLAVSEGKYITFLDGDDWIDKDYYFNMLERAKGSNVDIVCSGYTENKNNKYFVYTNLINSGQYGRESLEAACKSSTYRNSYYIFGIIPSLCTKIFEREHLIECIKNVPDMITIGEDGACTYPFLLHCKKIVVMNENVGYYYRKFSGSMMNSYSGERVEQILSAAKYLDKEIKTEINIYEDQKWMYFFTFLKYAIMGEAMSIGEMGEKIQRLDYMCKDEVMHRTLRNTRRTAIPFKLMLKLLEWRKYRLVIYCYKFYNLLSSTLKMIRKLLKM